MSPTETPVRPSDPEPEPAPTEEPPPEPVDEGTVCEVCGRRGRAEGHH